MTARAQFTPQAEQDLVEQALYLAESASIEIADRFFEAAGRSADHLAGVPRMGKVWEGH